MSTATVKVEKHPVAPTIFLMVLGAVVGLFFGAAFLMASSMVSVAATGPLGAIMYMPMAMAAASVMMTIGLVATPIWALIGGSMFAKGASGKGSAITRDMGVTFFSETHPVTVRTNQLAADLGLPPVPFVGWYDAEDINAFAMGTKPENAMVVVSKGAVQKLKRPEFEAVLAHELGHIASNDMARMTYARGVQEALSFFLIFRGLKMFARWVFTPFSELGLLSFSRGREFTADRISARLTSPQAMIGALEAIEAESAKPPRSRYANTMLSSALNDGGLIATHPPIQSRIDALLSWEEKGSLAEEPYAPDGTPLPVTSAA